MNYIDLINHFWRIDEGAQFTGWETKLYFYLIKTANSLGWVNDFWHSDSRVSANVGMSVNTLKTSRNRLKQVGLIEFVSGGKGGRGQNSKTRYQILPPYASTKQENTPIEKPSGYQKLTPKLTAETEEETEGYQNLTPKLIAETEEEAGGYQNLIPKLTPKVIPKLTPKPPPINKLNETKLNGNKNNLPASESDLSEKKLTDKETLPALAEPKNELQAKEGFTKEQLKADLLNSELCRMKAKNCGILPEEYLAMVESFVETKFGLDKHKKWKDMADARENFLYWIPYYKSTIANKYGKPPTQSASGSRETGSRETGSRETGRQIVEQTTDSDSVVEPGADGVLRRVSGTGVQTFAG